MNELVPSARTHAIVERLGRALGAREGTGPDDNPLMRSMRDQSRAEGREAGRAEGLAESRVKMARQILRARGIEVSAGFPAGAPALHESSDDEVVAAAIACDSEEDFQARLRIRAR